MPAPPAFEGPKVRRSGGRTPAGRTCGLADLRTVQQVVDPFRGDGILREDDDEPERGGVFVRREEAADAFAAAFHEDGAAEHERGHVAADGGAGGEPVRFGHVRRPHRAQAGQDARGVRAAAGHAGADRDAFDDAQVDAEVRAADRALHRADRLDGEVLLRVEAVERGEGHAVLRDRFGAHRRVRAGARLHRLEERHRHHHAAQLVVAVGPAPEDFEREVHLARRVARRGVQDDAVVLHGAGILAHGAPPRPRG